MRLRPHAVGLAVLLVCLTAPTPAGAQSGDPEAGSPSGVIYEIPLDNARRDAAPTHKGGSSSSGGKSGGGVAGQDDGGGVRTSQGTISPIHSDNGFGSSSVVPGVVAAVGNAAKGGGKGGSGKAASGKSGSGKAGAKTPVVSSPAESLGPPKSATVTSTPSKSRAYWLLALALAVAAGIGVAGRYVARRR
jgi:hypothetical protein